jgi:hypothetical protein
LTKNLKGQLIYENDFLEWTGTDVPNSSTGLGDQSGQTVFLKKDADLFVNSVLVGGLKVSDVFDLLNLGRPLTQSEMDALSPRCFLAGTPILMADGTSKPIEEIRPGDEVAAFDPEAEQGLGPLRPGKVTRLFTNVANTIINLRGLHMTPGHVVLMDKGEWDIIARALRDDRGIVEQRGDKAVLVRARTGAEIGSVQDIPIRVIFADPASGRDRLAVVRAGIPVKARKREDGQVQLYSMADILTLQHYAIEPDGTIICKDGHRYEATPWADDEAPPYHLLMQQNWIIELDEEAYTPPWILDLPLECEEVGQMVVNNRPTAVQPAGSGFRKLN